MTTSRRTFLGMMAAAPVAARALPAGPAESVAAKAAGVSAGPQPWDTGAEVALAGSSHRKKTGAEIVQILLREMPPYKEAEIRHQAKQSRVLDPDLAGMRSLSVSAALRIQWERNYKRLRAAFLEDFLIDDQREELRKRFDLPWF